MHLILTDNRIRGTKLHQSTKDSSDKKEVITVSVHTSGGTRLLSGHAHADGTFTAHETRAGRK